MDTNPKWYHTFKPTREERLIQMPRMIIKGRGSAQTRLRQNASVKSTLLLHFHTRHLVLKSLAILHASEFILSPQKHHGSFREQQLFQPTPTTNRSLLPVYSDKSLLWLKTSIVSVTDYHIYMYVLPEQRCWISVLVAR